MTTNQQPPAANALSPGDLYKQCLARETNVLQSDLTRVRLYKLLFIERPGLPPLGYGALLELLRAAQSKEERWELLARWLKQENICEPEDILLFSINHLASKRLLGISMRDTTYASVVEVWGPYFIRLMAELKAGELTSVRKGQLVAQGYTLEAIESAAGKDSPIAAICDWLEGREIFRGRNSRVINAETIRNAHSRIFGPKYYSTSVFHKFLGPK